MNQATQLYYVSLMNITESGDSVVGTGAPAPLPSTYSQPCPLLPDPPAPSQILPKRLFARDPSPLLLGCIYNLGTAVTEATWTDGWAS